MKKNISAFIVIVCFIAYSIYSADVPVITPVSQNAVATSPEALTLINALIKGNSSFSVKLSHPLLPGKVRSWQQQGVIKYPTRQVPWMTFKKDVNELNTFLHSLLNKNPQTGLYYHLENLKKNEPLYRALQKIEQALTLYEAKIETTTTPFKLDKRSLEAMQQLINVYGTTFYQGKLLDLIKKFMTSFEQEAKELRENEEKETTQESKVKEERFEITTDYQFDMTDFDRMTPSYEPEPDFDLFSSELPDDFIESFFRE